MGHKLKGMSYDSKKLDRGSAHKKGSGLTAIGHADLFGKRRDPHDALKGLKKEFTFPPFSALNARDGHWNARKRMWWSLGVKSECARGVSVAESAMHIPGMDGGASLSLWDPVLCELMVKWFCPPDGIVIDPFCGFSILGCVASCLGRGFFGVDLNAAQVAQNQETASKVCGVNERFPVFISGDSTRLDRHFPSTFKADLLFSCPPYGDLERYSKDPADLSNVGAEEFDRLYRKVIKKSVGLLKENAFAVWVVGEYRDFKRPEAPYVGFVPATIEAFREAGMSFYNEMILLTPLGSVPVRTREAFIKSRKVGKCHQNILVFVKGDPRKASAWELD